MVVIITYNKRVDIIKIEKLTGQKDNNSKRLRFYTLGGKYIIFLFFMNS